MLIWRDGCWPQTLDAFEEGRREVVYGTEAAQLQDWVQFAEPGGFADRAAEKWIACGQVCAAAGVRLR